MLGVLCKNGHDWEGTGQSLRYRSTHQCVICHRVRSGTYGKRPIIKPPCPNGEKRCSQCGECKSANPEHFARDSYSTDGLHWSCRECEQKRHEASYANDPMRHQSYTRKWRELNPEKNQQSAAAWRERNRESERERHKTWRRLYPEKALASVRAWIKANPELYRAIRRAAALRRRARLAGSRGNVTAADIQAQHRRQAGRCHWCDCDLNETSYHADHYIPLARGGAHHPANIVLACPHCNMSRGAKLPDEWKRE